MKTSLNDFNNSHLHNHSQIIYLRQGDTELGVAPHVGAGITHFVKKTADTVIYFLRPATEVALGETNSEQFGCFPMIPFSGRVVNAKFTYKGRIIELPRHNATPHALHGDGWKFPWKVVNKNDTGIYLNLDNPRNGWPWEYRANLKIELGQHGFLMQLSYTNLANETVPVGLGLHPWFLPNAELKTSLGTKWQVNENYELIKKTNVTKADDFSEFKPVKGSNLDTGFSDWGHQALIRWYDCEYVVKVDASPSLAHVILYTSHSSGEWCLEPTSHAMNSFNLHEKNIVGNGTTLLKPQDTLTGTMQIDIISP